MKMRETLEKKLNELTLEMDILSHENDVGFGDVSGLFQNLNEHFRLEDEIKFIEKLLKKKLKDAELFLRYTRWKMDKTL
jgi:hypothetical protein